MRKNKHKRKKIVLIVILIIIFVIICQPSVIQDSDEKFERKCSLYSWEVADVDYNKLESICEDLKINCFYQYVPTRQINTKEIEMLVEKLYLMDVKFYLLVGEHEYAYDQQMFDMESIIDEVVVFNQNNEIKIEGIVFDVEFYLDEYKYNSNSKRDCFEDYYNNMKNAYDYSRNKDIEFITVIPYWLDTEIGESELEKLIKNACDTVEVMNYYKSKTIEHIENETKFAKKYNKEIVTISELQDENVKSIVPEITFFYDGLKNCRKSMEKILQRYKYDKMGYAYHYYKYVKILYEKIQ